MIEELERYGAPADWVEGQRGSTEPFELHRDAWPTMRLFLACGTQWRSAGMSGVVTGLDYGAVARAAEWNGVKMTRRRFDEIRAMEHAAMDVWNSKDR